MIRKIKNDDFDSVYAIMEKSFPINEHRPYGEQKLLLDDQHYGIYVATDDGSGKIIAFIAVWQFDGVGYIEHFATDPECRGRGIGSRLLCEVTELLNGRICLEVEPPDSEITLRRIHFYERHGFFLNEYPYIQPPISAGRDPLPLMIMTQKSAVNEKEFNEIRELLYKEVYHVDLK